MKKRTVIDKEWVKRVKWAPLFVAAVLLVGCAGGNKAPSETAKPAGEAAVSDRGAGGEAESIDKDGVLTVGFDQNFPPMGFIGEDGAFTGFDLELAAEAAKRMGLEIKYQPIEWDAKDLELESGNIDVIWNGFTMNGREEAYLWTEPYMDNAQVFVVAKDSGITNFGDLAGKIVEVQADSSAEAALKDMPDLTATFGQLLTTPDYNTAFMDLEMGAVDAIAMDIIVAGYQMEKRADDAFTILEENLAGEQYGVGMKKGNEVLRDTLQKTLFEMAADGTMAEISEKWFGSDITTVGVEKAK